MSDSTVVTLAENERDEFLGNGGTGVISFATERESGPHSVPVSYGYDEAQSTFYFRLATSKESEKGDLANRPVTFVTYGETDAGYRSVVATGHLERTTDEGIATETLDGLQRVEIPYIDIFDRPTREVSFEFYRLVPDDLTSRKAVQRGD